MNEPAIHHHGSCPLRSHSVYLRRGCISRGHIWDTSGVTVREISEQCEIVSLNGTVSQNRCHLHIALSKEDLSTISGHLFEGYIINTTCELVVAEIPGTVIEKEFDDETGYEKLVFDNQNA